MQDLDLVHPAPFSNNKASCKALFIFGSFRNGYKEWIFHLVKAIGIDPFNRMEGRKRKVKLFLLAAFSTSPR